jgi:hypothetical protein
MVSKFERQNLTDEQIAEMEKFDREQRRDNDNYANHTVRADDVDDLSGIESHQRIAVNCWTRTQWRRRKTDAEREGAE